MSKASWTGLLRARRVLAGVVVVAALLSPAQPGLAQQQEPRWVGAWGNALSWASPEEAGSADFTCRWVLRTTTGGPRVRVWLSNAFGDRPLELAAVTVAVKDEGPAVQPGSVRAVTFGGQRQVSIPAGQRIASDPVDLQVRPLQELAVSTYHPGAVVRADHHHYGLATSYCTAPGGGDVTADPAGTALTRTRTYRLWVAGVDVTDPTTTAVVAFGDSITDGTGSTVDGYDTWPDRLAERLVAAELPYSVLNMGIGGNAIAYPPDPQGTVPPPARFGESGLERLARDALSLPGASHLVAFIGTNDIGLYNATAEEIIAAHQQLIARAHEDGLVVIGATMIPRSFNARNEQERQEFNAWMRTNDDIDCVIDFDAITRDSRAPTRIYPPYDVGDNVHPSPTGYHAMGSSVDLALMADACVPGARGVVRVAGGDRVATSVEVSRMGYATATTVVLARADSYPDGLTGAPLAAHLGGPLLLTPTSGLAAAVREEVGRLGATQAVLLGGRAALGDAVDQQLGQMGLQVRRVEGPDRFATAAAIAAQLPATTTAVVALGAASRPEAAWPDALAAAPYAAFTRRPILLARPDGLPAATQAALEARGVTETILVGGTGAISASVHSQLQAAGHGPRRLAGVDRYATSAAVSAEGLAAGMDPGVTWLASGLAFPDALAAGPTVAALGHSLLLVDGRDLSGSAATTGALDARGDDLRLVRVLGGGAAVSSGVEQALRQRLRSG